MADKLTSFDFSALVAAIRQAHEYMAAQAGRAVNISLTLRNWVIGCYIREYEQNGADRATYGENLLSSLSQRLEEAGVGGCASRSLRLYRQFYLTYPEIWQTLSAKFAEAIPATIRKSLIPESTSVATPRHAWTSTGQVPDKLNILAFCRTERSVKEMMTFFNMKHRETFMKNYIHPLIEESILSMTIPDKPRSSKQRYVTTPAGIKQLERLH